MLLLALLQTVAKVFSVALLVTTSSMWLVGLRLQHDREPSELLDRGPIVRRTLCARAKQDRGNDNLRLQCDG